MSKSYVKNTFNQKFFDKIPALPKACRLLSLNLKAEAELSSALYLQCFPGFNPYRGIIR
jgi:hypothetical protein